MPAIPVRPDLFCTSLVMSMGPRDVNTPPPRFNPDPRRGFDLDRHHLRTLALNHALRLVKLGAAELTEESEVLGHHQATSPAVSPSCMGCPLCTVSRR